VAVVSTVLDRCKRCFSCVRNCPVKAIKVENGQAQVIQERCISCGTCEKACSQQAKKIEDGTEQLVQLLDTGKRMVACLAPSFAAAFPEIQPGKLVAAVRDLGFSEVREVAYGAEMVAREYRRLLRERKGQTIVSSPCPAITNMVEKHYPALIPFLAPIVSPMIAQGRAIKEELGPDVGVVFIGPCVAKKDEAKHPSVAGAVDVVLTFKELKMLLDDTDPSQLEPSEFDGPRPMMGRIFPISGGLLRTAAISSDIFQSSVLIIEGKDDCSEFVANLNQGRVKPLLVDILFCKGCIDGPEMDNQLSRHERQNMVLNFLKSRMTGDQDQEYFAEKHSRAVEVDLGREFDDRCLILPMPSEEEIRDILSQTGKTKPSDELNCGACGYHTCRDKAVAVYQGLAEIEMCFPHLFYEAEKLAITDGLTGVFNHRFFQERLSEEIKRFDRQRNLAVIMVDIDHFKEYNDRNGHLAGDKVLKSVAEILGSNLRDTDTVARYGGDEFALILPCVDAAEAFQVAERIRKTVEDQYFCGEERIRSGKITVSIGVSGFSTKKISKQEMIRKADEALYAAKRERNKVQIC